MSVDDLFRLHILDNYDRNWRNIFLDLARFIFCISRAQPTPVNLTQDECRDQLAIALKTWSRSFERFIISQNRNLPGGAYLDLADAFAQYVIDRDWSSISRC